MEQLNIFVAENWVMILVWFVLLGMLVHSFTSGAQDISPQQAVNMMNHEACIVVDVREENELGGGLIRDSIHIPLSGFKQRIGELEKHKDKTIIMSCRSGMRSRRTCGMLKREGFEKVFNLRGGILAWENENLPVRKGK